jgi:hypothetical protein
MSRKHNCPKRGMRSKSRYRDRLAARGMKTTPAMADAESLAKIQQQRTRATGSPWWQLGHDPAEDNS